MSSKRLQARKLRLPALVVTAVLSGGGLTGELAAQPETLLKRATLDGLAGTVSGSRALHNLIEIAGYNRDRQADEFAGTWFESDYIARKAREYDFSDVQIHRYPRNPIWDGIAGELWTTSPVLRKIADFRDIPTVLAPGSVTGTYEGELVWIENAAEDEAYTGVDVKGKIVGTSSSTRAAFTKATSLGALGVVNMNAPRPYETPEAIVWSSIGQPDDGFAFNLSAFMVQDLKQLAGRGPVQLKAVVESEWREVDDEVITAVIPGNGSTDEWIYYSAHLFEGINKQGAADDGSGAVLILEAGRTILEAIQNGSVSRPARSMRFLWVDEFRGTQNFIGAFPDEFAKVTADINIDMAGQNVTLNNNATRLYRMPDSRIHFLADVAQEFFEWVGRTNIERVHERRSGYAFAYPLLDPYGTRDAWRYRIEPFYGSSDHQVYNDRGVPAVLFNHWPDMVYHTSHDRPDSMDATQMKRTAFIAAATGLVVAGVAESDPLAVASVAHSRGQARIAANLMEWRTHMSSLPGRELAVFSKDFQSAVDHWFRRELQNVNSVSELEKGADEPVAVALRDTLRVLTGGLKQDLRIEQAGVAEFMAALGRAKGITLVAPGLTAEEEEASRMVPEMIGEVPRRARAQGLPGFAAMEVRNFIDGSRSALEIRNAVNAEYRLEYGPVELEAVLAYLKVLEEGGAVRITMR